MFFTTSVVNDQTWIVILDYFELFTPTALSSVVNNSWSPGGSFIVQKMMLVFPVTPDLDQYSEVRQVLNLIRTLDMNILVASLRLQCH